MNASSRPLCGLERIAVLLVVLAASCAVGCSCSQSLAIRAGAGHADFKGHIYPFLFGSPSDPNHAPSTWLRMPVHLEAGDTARYFVDAGLAGADTDADEGVDVPTVFFIASHGVPSEWAAWNSQVDLRKVALGNPNEGGRLSYFWQCICQTLAHGPREIESDLTLAYSWPEKFDGSKDSVVMANAFERWGGTHFGRRLRLACGSSTNAPCMNASVYGSIWNHYLSFGYDVADSFSEGLVAGGQHSETVPVCMAVGGDNWDDSPLFDQRFTAEENATTGSHYYLQFRKQIIKEKTAFGVAVMAQPQDSMPVFRALDLSSSGAGHRKTLEGVSALVGGVTARRTEEQSGAVYYDTGLRPMVGPVKPWGGATSAGSVAGAQSMIEALLGQRFALDVAVNEIMRVARAADGTPLITKPLNDHLRTKDVFLTFRRLIDVGSKCVGGPGAALAPSVGSGGVVKIQMGGDGRILRVAIVLREIEASGGPTACKTVTKESDAAALATEQLKEMVGTRVSQYHLDPELSRWGYKEEPGNVAQAELKIVWQFVFFPNDGVDPMTASPVLIEVPAQ